MDFITVYNFKVWNYEIGELRPSLRMATRASIERLGVEIIEETEKSVPVTKIDDNGFFKPG